MLKRTRGVFERPVDSGIWWTRYADASGRIRREKVGSKSSAVKIYVKRKAAVLEGKKLPENLRSVTRVSDLAPAFLRDYEMNRRKSYDSADRRLRKHILPFFGPLAADTVTTDDINRYVDNRKREGAENATINRELAALKRMFNIAHASQPPKVRQVPKFPRFKENAPRSGFVEDADYAKLIAAAEEPWLKTILAAAYTFGFRRSELLNMRVGQIDLVNRKISLVAGSTKNDEARTVKMTVEVYNLIIECVRGKKPNEYVFTRGQHEPVLDFRGSWYAVCTKAGLGKFARDEDNRSGWDGLIFHDLRRSAVRNMVRRAVPEKVAMMISGHKTRSVFDRYNIIDETDIEKATAKIEAGRDASRIGSDAAQATGTKTSTCEAEPVRIVTQHEVNYSSSII